MHEEIGSRGAEMSIITRIFGSWEIQFEAMCEADYTGMFGSGTRDVRVVIEKNSKTGKERAFLENPSGRKMKISVGFVRCTLPGAMQK